MYNITFTKATQNKPAFSRTEKGNYQNRTQWQFTFGRMNNCLHQQSGQTVEPLKEIEMGQLS